MPFLTALFISGGSTVTPNERITRSAYALLRGEIKGEPEAGGLCLALVRTVLEHAFWDGKREFYARHRTHNVERGTGSSTDPYARDLERSLTRQGMALNLPRTGPTGDAERYVSMPSATASLMPGDLLFRWDVVPDAAGVFVGHTAIILPGGLVLENVAKRAGALQRGPTTLSRLGAWPITTVIRFQPS